MNLKRTLLVASIAALPFVCIAAEPEAPFWLAGRPPDPHRTTLDIRIIPATNAIVSSVRNDGVPVLVFPIRIENHSDQTISAKIHHEWYGGIWPSTGLAAAARKANGTSWESSPVYQVGELGVIEKPTEWQPGKIYDFSLRLDWPGTGSMRNVPLIETKAVGEYLLRISLVFNVGTSTNYVESSEIHVSVNENADKK